jgi:isoleucyl-tRNA synthetase
MNKPGFIAAEDRGVTVVLDTNLSDALIREGYAREVISKVQTMRKDTGFEVTDRISLYYECDDELAAALEEYRDMIGRTTLATSIARGKAPEGAAGQQWDINGKKAVLAVQKA